LNAAAPPPPPAPPPNKKNKKNYSPTQPPFPLFPGIGISIGKVALYVAGGGFHPEHSLPVVLDVGCNRQELLEDKFYMVSSSGVLYGAFLGFM
jgi:hypothetical protein